MKKSFRSTVWWQDLFKRYEHLGITKTRFCRQEGVPTSQFYQHAKLLWPDLVYNNKLRIKCAQATAENFMPLISRQDISIKIGDLNLAISGVPSAKWVSELIKHLGEAHV